MENFTKTITSAIEQRKISQAELARLAGYKPQYISDLLSGKRRWNETTIDKVCKALGIEIDFKTPEMTE